MYKNKDQSVILTELVLFLIFIEILYDTLFQLDLKLNRMSKIPLKRQIIFVNGILSARPTNPIPVVRINIQGPTKASNVLI